MDGELVGLEQLGLLYPQIRRRPGMKRFVVIAAIVGILLMAVHVLPASITLGAIHPVATAVAQVWGDPGGGGVDDCWVCEHYAIPSACRRCAYDTYWDEGGCFPGDPNCA